MEKNVGQNMIKIVLNISIACTEYINSSVPERGTLRLQNNKTPKCSLRETYLKYNNTEYKSKWEKKHVLVNDKTKKVE